ncbi:MAG: hypothetical protein QM808_04030 [Steroidobacteraceae bacterium]
MKITGLEKTYPELSGLSYDVQNKILINAKHQVATSGGRQLILGLKPVVFSALVSAIISALLSLLFGPGKAWSWAGPMMGGTVGVNVALAINKYNNKILRPKIRELAAKEKFKTKIEKMDV